MGTRLKFAASLVWIAGVYLPEILLSLCHKRQTIPMAMETLLVSLNSGLFLLAAPECNETRPPTNILKSWVASNDIDNPILVPK